MTYQVLARKWRPQDFASLVGQEHVVTALRNALADRRIAQAYLFSGIRGVGKTTAARLLAKALNCEQGPTPEPCNRCTPCREITAGSDLDVLEVDAATYSKVEQVRELTESLRYGAARDRYKVVVLDEIHRLSRQAFDALLKIVEEPPPHLVFVFATTESEAVPATILSRCQEFHFRRVASDVLARYLRGICEAEEIETSDAALRMIARAGEGSVRDSVALLDQLATFGGGTIADEDAARLLGGLDAALLHDLLAALVAGDGAAVTAIAANLEDEGRDPRHVFSQFLSYCRDALHLALGATGTGTGRVDLPEEETEALGELARAAGYENLLRLVQQLLGAETMVRRSENGHLAAEIAWLRAAELPKLVRVEELLGGGGGGEPRSLSVPRRRPAGGGAGEAAGARSALPAREPRDGGEEDGAGAGQGSRPGERQPTDASATGGGAVESPRAASEAASEAAARGPQDGDTGREAGRRSSPGVGAAAPRAADGDTGGNARATAPPTAEAEGGVPADRPPAGGAFASGGPASGETGSGGPASSGPASSEPASGGPASGEPAGGGDVSGDPGNGAAAAGSRSAASGTPANGSADAGAGDLPGEDSPGGTPGAGGPADDDGRAEQRTMPTAAASRPADRAGAGAPHAGAPLDEPSSGEPEHVRAQAGDPAFDGMDLLDATSAGGADDLDAPGGPGRRASGRGAAPPAAKAAGRNAPDASGTVAAFVDEVRRAKQPLAAYLDHAELAFEDGGLVVRHDAEDEVLRSRLENPANREILDRAVRRTWGPGTRWAARAGRLAPPAGGNGDPGAAEEDETAAGGEEAQPGPEILEHPTVQTVLELFGGTIATVEERDD